MSLIDSVVIATDSLEPSGMGEHMITLGSALKGVRRVVIGFPAEGTGRRYLDRCARLGFETVVVDESFPTWIEGRRPEILHVHAGIGWEGHHLVDAGRRAGLITLRTEHLPYVLTDQEQQRLHREMFGKLDRLLVVSKASAETFRERGFQVHVVRNGISPKAPAFPRDEVRRELGLSADASVITTVARFTPQKGHAVLLHAAAELPDNHTYLLVGDGPERKAMEKLALDLGLRDARFLGERSDVPEILSASDIFVLPSLFEGLPLVVLEAMSAALPIVATRIGGTVEALGAAYPYLVTSGDPRELAYAIKRCASAADIQDTAQAARRRFLEKFTAERMGHEVATHYLVSLSQRQVA